MFGTYLGGVTVGNMELYDYRCANTETKTPDPLEIKCPTENGYMIALDDYGLVYSRDVKKFGGKSNAAEICDESNTFPGNPIEVGEYADPPVHDDERFQYESTLHNLDVKCRKQSGVFKDETFFYKWFANRCINENTCYLTMAEFDL